MTYAANQNFTPWLFIGIGETHAYFTLRETYLHAIPGDGPRGNAVINGVYQGSYEVRSRHIVNLSQDADEAFSKASEIAEKMGYELRAKADTLAEEMRDIQKASAEERARREQVVREQEAKWEAERAARDQEMRNTLMKGEYVFGPYRGKEFKEASRGYITWLANNVSEFAEDSLLKLTAELVLERCADLVLPKPKENVYVGTIGKRQVFKATVLRCIPFDGFYGRTYFTTMVDKETGARLLSKSGSFSANEGEDLEFKATVKEHGDYKGMSQTIIQRISVI